MQYQIVSVDVKTPAAAVGQMPSLPSNWSMPLGPNQEKSGEPWEYANTVAVAPLVGATNRYAYLGATLTFGIRLLDIYGNALPEPHTLPVEFVYNDPLVPVNEWPGARAYYAFASSGPGVTLELLFDFDPARLGAGQLPATDAKVLAGALGAYGRIYDQLTDPLQANNPAAGVQVITVLAPQPLSATSDGTSLRCALAAFVQSLITWLKQSMQGQTPPVPEPLHLDFTLDRGAVKALVSDITELTMALVFFRAPDTVLPSIAAAMPSVQRVSSTLGAAVSLTPQAVAASDGPDLQLAAFAQAFERAWYGFDEGTAQLKLAQGLSGSSSGRSGSALELWCVRMGAGAGIGVDFPNATAPSPAALPVAFAPQPLSTQLISRQAKVRIYADDWNGTGSDVLADQDHVFTGVDLDNWALSSLSDTDALFAPRMASAIAALDASRYHALSTCKQTLSDQISTGLANVPDGAWPNPADGCGARAFPSGVAEQSRHGLYAGRCRGTSSECGVGRHRRTIGAAALLWQAGRPAEQYQVDTWVFAVSRRTTAGRWAKPAGLPRIDARRRGAGLSGSDSRVRRRAIGTRFPAGP